MRSEEGVAMTLDTQHSRERASYHNPDHSPGIKQDSPHRVVHRAQVFGAPLGGVMPWGAPAALLHREAVLLRN